MPVLMMIDRVLDLKITQWLLLICVASSLVVGVWGTLRVNALRVEKTYYELAYTKASAGLATQNEAVQQLAEETELQKEMLEEASKQASKLALENAKTLKGILGYAFTGDCSAKVSQALKLIKDAK